MSASSPVGRVFKIETMGAVDGPGLRLVLFLQGCPLRCPYCHNPEGWPLSGGREIAIDEVMATLRRYRAYYEGGGLTLSGGEPLTQAAFARELFERCRAEGVHTALDTSACMMYDESIAAMDAADLLLLDVKSPDPKVCARVFGFPLENVVNILRRAEERGQKVWARHVIAPKISDSTENVEKLEKLLRTFSCVEKVELLPFRKLCAEKYEALGIPFPMGAEEEVSDAIGGIMVKKKECGL